MKTAVITGVSSGLGECFAKKFLAEGYEVIGLSRTKPNLDITFIETDFTNEDSIKNAVNIIKKYTKLDTLVFCAGIGNIEGLDEVNYEKSQEVFDVNILGQNYLLSELQNDVKQSESDIIFIGATIGFKANSFMPVYSISKWAVRGLVENWREYFKKTKVRVIGVHPGGLETQSNVGDGGREHIIAAITGGSVPKLMDPQEIADFVYTTTQLPKNIEVSEMIINRK